MARKNTEKGPRRTAPEAREKTREAQSRRSVTIDDAVTNAHGASNSPPSPEHPSPDEIAARAHEIFLARGAASGMELDDWLRAERELCFPGLRD
jgi:Protein of unknown function (DUF2934)